MIYGDCVLILTSSELLYIQSFSLAWEFGSNAEST